MELLIIKICKFGYGELQTTSKDIRTKYMSREDGIEISLKI